MPKGIQQCEGNYNLTKDGVACYVVNGDHVTVYLDTKFTYDSDELNASGKSAIESFVKFVKSNNIKSVSVEGYASKKSDGQEYELYNDKLSHNRAESVAAYMNSLGIDSSQITTTGFGYGNPLVPNTTKQNRDYNQRVQASITAPLKKENT